MRTCVWGRGAQDLPTHPNMLICLCVSDCCTCACKYAAPWPHPCTPSPLQTLTSLSPPPCLPGCSAFKWLWLLEHVPAVAAAVAEGDACMGTVDSWLMWCLTGTPTSSSTSSTSSVPGSDRTVGAADGGAVQADGSQAVQDDVGCVTGGVHVTDGKHAHACMHA